MSNSGKKINYSLRPSKNIERKMMRDMFLRVGHIYNLNDYTYLGFGSKYFEDFSLFHKSLHINKMISIEGDTNNRKRYEFNKPFDCIEIHFGMSNEVLPKLEYNNPIIAWLDYDSRFNQTMLFDLSLLAQRVKKGSVIALSYNSETYSSNDLVDESNRTISYRDKFVELVGEENVPTSLDERGWSKHSNFCNFIQNAVKSTLEVALKERNDAALVNNKLKALQLMYFRYADGQKMTTLVYFLYEDGDDISRCRFDDLYFYRSNSEAYNIETPNLTLKEIRHLNELMPLEDERKVCLKVFNSKDVKLFKANYRYFPSFTEVESY
ncbi:hypothetical protein JG635_04715 [Vibrio cholerae]|nr:hypothetical protein [Vibrio cholerae]